MKTYLAKLWEECKYLQDFIEECSEYLSVADDPSRRSYGTEYDEIQLCKEDLKQSKVELVSKQGELGLFVISLLFQGRPSALVSFM